MASQWAEALAERYQQLVASEEGRRRQQQQAQQWAAWRGVNAPGGAIIPFPAATGFPPQAMPQYPQPSLPTVPAPPQSPTPQDLMGFQFVLPDGSMNVITEGDLAKLAELFFMVDFKYVLRHSFTAADATPRDVPDVRQVNLEPFLLRAITWQSSYDVAAANAFGNAANTPPLRYIWGDEYRQFMDRSGLISSLFGSPQHFHPLTKGVLLEGRNQLKATATSLLAGAARQNFDLDVTFHGIELKPRRK